MNEDIAHFLYREADTRDPSAAHMFKGWDRKRDIYYINAGVIYTQRSCWRTGKAPFQSARSQIEDREVLCSNPRSGVLFCIFS